MMSSAEIWAGIEASADVLAVRLSLVEVSHIVSLLGKSELDEQLKQKLAREITAQKLSC